MKPFYVRIFESELACLVHETSIHSGIETGGSLYGLWTDAGNATVVLASRPGPRAVRQTTQFEQDSDAHQAVERVLAERFGVQAVGLWHSHHRLGLHELSGGDLGRTMGFARRHGRRRFCDLLSFIDEPPRYAGSPRSEVTVKPYIYADAGQGVRAPTEFILLPGTSPVRAALRPIPADLEQFQFALAEPPPDWRPRVRLGRSVEVGTATGEDDDVPKKRGWFGKKPVAALEAAAEPAPEPPPSSAVAVPAAAVRPAYAIEDVSQYVTDYLEPSLRRIPAGASCELEVFGDGRYLRLVLVSARHAEQHELELGWDGAAPVVLGHVCRLASERGPQDLLDGEPVAMPDRLARVLKSLAEWR
ncbi:MAG TPA: hypothetical protein VG497_06615 [Kribbella sp.]|nr:hypothetical protein [Kribbella sp.]